MRLAAEPVCLSERGQGSNAIRSTHILMLLLCARFQLFDNGRHATAI